MRLLTIIVKLNYYSDYFVVILFVISPWSSTTVVHPPSGSGCCTNTYIFILTSFSHFGLVANESARHPPWRVTINNTLFHCTRHPRLRTTTASTHFTSVSHVHEQKLGRRRLHTLKSLLSLHIWSLKCFPLRHSSCSEPPVDSNVTSFVKCEKNSIKEEEKLGLGGEISISLPILQQPVWLFRRSHFVQCRPLVDQVGNWRWAGQLEHPQNS